jgi:hypothetical protein
MGHYDLQKDFDSGEVVAGAVVGVANVDCAERCDDCLQDFVVLKRQIERME